MLLGFGAMAAALAAVPGYMAYEMQEIWAASPRPTNVEGMIAQAFLPTAVVGGAGRKAPVRIDAMPLGIAKAAALQELGDNSFSCSQDGKGADCLRHVEPEMSKEDWIVSLTFDDSGRVSDRPGLLRENVDFP